MPDTLTSSHAEAVAYLLDVSDVNPRVRPVYLAYLTAREEYFTACDVETAATNALDLVDDYRREPRLAYALVDAIASTERAIRESDAARRAWAQAYEDATGERFPLTLYGRNG